MPLVSQNIVAAWYRRDSWVYRNLAFLYVNPLWKRNVPKGFSLCPLFWSALFSLFIFRPFAYAVYGFGRAVKTLKLGKAVEWTDRLVLKTVRGECTTPMVPTFIGLALLFQATLCVYGLTQATIAYIEAGVLLTFILPLVLVAILVASGIYVHNRGEERCRVEVYSRIAAALSVIAAFVVHPSLAWWSFVKLPIAAVTGVAHFVSFVAVGIWHGLVIAGIWIANLTIGVVPFLPATLGILAVAAIYGWVAMRMMDKALDKEVEKASKRISAKEYSRNISFICGALAEICWDRNRFNYQDKDLWMRHATSIPAIDDLASSVIGVDHVAPIADVCIKWMDDYIAKRNVRQAAWDTRCCQIVRFLTKL